MINRAFASLYLIIVLAILLLGLVLNKFWDELNPPQTIDPAVVDLIAILEHSLQSNNNQDKQELLNNLSEKYGFNAAITQQANFSKTIYSEKLARGEIVSASDEQTHFFYKRIENSEDVLSLTYENQYKPHNEIYIALVVVFYLAIAGVVFLWVWPLTRDLTRLTDYAQQMGGEHSQTTLAISTHSVLYPFAKVFNAMAKRLEDLLRTQKEMTLAVSHELRTPLARMKFALAITEGQKDPAQLWRQLDSVSRDIVEMESLINSLLAYAAFDQQTQHLNQTGGHIQDLVREIVGRLSHQLKKDIHIHIEDRTQGLEMRCEWSLMQTAIQNLLVNAIDYANKQINISLEVEQDRFKVVIDDDGPGIPVEYRARVFESFVRIYNDDTNRSGFGLGLALVKRIMEWHSGSVECKDSALGGASFTLCWPK